jgi:hypothetical protein
MDQDVSIRLARRDEQTMLEASPRERIRRCSATTALLFNAANSDSVPGRAYSKPWRSARPGDNGNTGSKRSRT